MYLGILLILIVQNAVLVSAVVMVGELAASWFVKVFRPAIFINWCWCWFLFPPSRFQTGFYFGKGAWYYAGFDEEVGEEGEAKEYVL